MTICHQAITVMINRLLYLTLVRDASAKQPPPAQERDGTTPAQKASGGRHFKPCQELLVGTLRTKFLECTVPRSSALLSAAGSGHHHRRGALGWEGPAATGGTASPAPTANQEPLSAQPRRGLRTRHSWRLKAISAPGPHPSHRSANQERSRPEVTLPRRHGTRGAGCMTSPNPAKSPPQPLRTHPAPAADISAPQPRRFRELGRLKATPAAIGSGSPVPASYWRADAPPPRRQLPLAGSQAGARRALLSPLPRSEGCGFLLLSCPAACSHRPRRAWPGCRVQYCLVPMPTMAHWSSHLQHWAVSWPPQPASSTVYFQV